MILMGDERNTLEEAYPNYIYVLKLHVKYCEIKIETMKWETGG